MRLPVTKVKPKFLGAELVNPKVVDTSSEFVFSLMPDLDPLARSQMQLPFLAADVQAKAQAAVPQLGAQVGEAQVALTDQKLQAIAQLRNFMRTLRKCNR